jgi:N-acetylglucosaminyl-diphospho-decaprenol L-rhamnosyltransferase
MIEQLGIVIVTHSSAGQVGRAIDACGSAAAGAAIVVVDNASTDASVDEVRRRPGAVLVANAENRGFAGAVNQGVAALPEAVAFVLLVNPDSEPLSGIEAMMRACAVPGTAAAGGRLIDHLGRLQTGFYVRRFPTPGSLIFEVLGVNRLWPANPVNRRYRYLDHDPEQPGFVDQPAGAFLMFRRDAWRAVGGFDERFHPIWFEDVDFCLRLQRAGNRIAYVPGAAARHAGAGSIRNVNWGSRQVWWYTNLIKYTAKHFSPWASRGVAIAVTVGVSARALVARRNHSTAEVVSVYSRVIRLACRSGLTGLRAGLE